MNKKMVQSKENSMEDFMRNTSDPVSTINLMHIERNNTLCTSKNTNISLRHENIVYNYKQSTNIIQPQKKLKASTEPNDQKNEKSKKLIEQKIASNQRSCVKTSDLSKSLVLITGSVEYIVNLNKTSKNIYAIYEFYGILLKKFKGKYETETVILIRGNSGTVVLAAKYYEIDLPLPSINIGSDIMGVGRFNNNNFQLFKIKQVLKIDKSSINRFQNICNFTLNKISN